MQNMRMWSLIAMVAVVGLTGLPTAFAATQDYSVLVNTTVQYTISGGTPSLNPQSIGSAHIVTYTSTTVDVMCDSVPTGEFFCTGTIVR